jgi:hypothetical protein
MFLADTTPSPAFLHHYDLGNGYMLLDIVDRKLLELECRAGACAGGF